MTSAHPTTTIPTAAFLSAASPNNFLRGGYTATRPLQYTGIYGYYWSFTAFSPTNAGSLGFSGSGASPSDNRGRHGGFSLRCVAK